jgi:hypothetical protein
LRPTVAVTGNNTGIVVPEEATEQLAAGQRPHVLVNVNGCEYRNTAGVMGTRHRNLGLQLAAAVIGGAAMRDGQGRWAPFPVREHAPVVPGCGYRVSD